jgi:tocopherol O-methyltransferase
MTTATPAGDVDAALNSAVERYYDTTLDLYERMWGEHVHHGYWNPGESPAADGADRHEATDRLVHKLAEFAAVPAGARVLDVGCGIGGPALYLAGDRGCTVQGVTLSAAQAARATQKAAELGLVDRASFARLDALSTGYPDASFDVVWALESLMHIPDRPAFFAESLRLLRPGGTLAVGTWASRDGDLSADDDKILQLILRHQVMPSFSSLAQHDELCRSAGFTGVELQDWSDAVANSWDPAFALTPPVDRGNAYMMDLARERGVDVLGFFYAGPLMKKGFDTGAMRYGVLRATKPGGSS